MNKQELQRRLQDHPAVCWILWETRNLYEAFSVAEDNGPKLQVINTIDDPTNHEMVDTIENITGSCMKILGLNTEDMDNWDMLEDIEITLKPKPRDEASPFIIAI